MSRRQLVGVFGERAKLDCTSAREECGCLRRVPSGNEQLCTHYTCGQRCRGSRTCLQCKVMWRVGNVMPLCTVQSTVKGSA